ncbi:hypothetical protein Acr_03g0001370 [Actinidia rufa]|uniref:CCHC-type domain-containing protein n=1 Tax=Actinidia rufa TaxID=165716 RepID=A0A7J0EA71_9ERIC|nr:hypothetical protein Acr_03g0001370 [Actinidia rufa]
MTGFDSPHLTSDRTPRCSPDGRCSLLLRQALVSPLGPRRSSTVLVGKALAVSCVGRLRGICVWSVACCCGSAVLCCGSACDVLLWILSAVLWLLWICCFAFAIIDGDERRRHLIQASPAISPGSTPIADQMAFAAFGSGPRSSGGKPICSYCGNLGHIRKRCFKLHPELKETSSKRKGKGPPRTATVVETSPRSCP